MTGIPNTLPTLAELERLHAEKRAAITNARNAPAGAVDQLANLWRAVQIVFLASRVTYFEASDPSEEEIRKYGVGKV